MFSALYLKKNPTPKPKEMIKYLWALVTSLLEETQQTHKALAHSWGCAKGCILPELTASKGERRLKGSQETLE